METYSDARSGSQKVLCESRSALARGGLPLEICPRIYDSAENTMRSESEHCSIWWMSRCDGRVLEKNFMKTYCVRLAASAGAPEHASRVEFLRQKIKKTTMIRDFFKNPEVQVELAD